MSMQAHSPTSPPLPRRTCVSRLSLES